MFLLLFLLLIPVSANAQTCVSSSMDELSLLTTNDADYFVIMQYAAHKGFDTSAPGPVQKCTRTDSSVYYVTNFPSPFLSHPSAVLVYDTSAPMQFHARLTFQRGQKQIFIVSTVVVRRLLLDSNGQPRYIEIRDLRGKHLVPRVALPASLARRLLRLRVLISGSSQCQQYTDDIHRCIVDYWNTHSVAGLATDAFMLAQNLHLCAEGDPLKCIDAGIDAFQMIVETCSAQIPETGSCTTTDCKPGLCTEAYPGIPVCRATNPTVQSECYNCAIPEACLQAGDCMCHDGTTSTTSTTIPSCSQCVTCVQNPVCCGCSYVCVGGTNNCPPYCVPDPC